ncbi:hypothetical protein COO60DRAFT_943531 [Scenedesmus sp. NREL 46B-D3]|nr:hypothetical protein COO60DRAFT_943531 [Scenedesmus sp. NREL 46B-D3]
MEGWYGGVWKADMVLGLRVLPFTASWWRADFALVFCRLVGWRVLSCTASWRAAWCCLALPCCWCRVVLLGLATQNCVWRAGLVSKHCISTHNISQPGRVRMLLVPLVGMPRPGPCCACRWPAISCVPVMGIMFNRVLCLLALHHTGWSPCVLQGAACMTLCTFGSRWLHIVP